MISIGPDKKKCWIRSIVELPTFYPADSIIRGAMYAEASEVYEPFDMAIQQNRDIRIPPCLTKYKLEVMLDNEMYDVVGIAQMRFDPAAINSQEVGNIAFYPIFIHAGRSTYLFIESINDMFLHQDMVVSPVGTHSVISPFKMIEHIDAKLYPCRLQSDMYDSRFSRIQRPMTLLDIIMTELGSDNDESTSTNMEETLCVREGEIPLEIQFLSNVRSVGQLRSFLNPYGNMPSDIARMAMCSRGNWSEIQSQLTASNALPTMTRDVYFTNAEDFSCTGVWLSAIYTQDMNDFVFPITLSTDEKSRQVYVQKCDIRNNFRKSFECIDSYSDLVEFINMSFNIEHFTNKNPNIEIEGQRSWFEDIVIRDKNTGQILMYIDMVYWMLACADGLINDGILDYIDGNPIG